MASPTVRSRITWASRKDRRLPPGGGQNPSASPPGKSNQRRIGYFNTLDSPFGGMSVQSGDGFDRWLEQQLQPQAVKQSGPSPMPAQAQYHATYLQGGPHMSALAHSVSVVSAKGAIGLTVAALALGTAGADAPITGRASPRHTRPKGLPQGQNSNDT